MAYCQMSSRGLTERPILLVVRHGRLIVYAASVGFLFHLRIKRRVKAESWSSGATHRPAAFDPLLSSGLWPDSRLPDWCDWQAPWSQTGAVS